MHGRHHFQVILFASNILSYPTLSKLARPKKRASTLMFSKNAVICQRDGTNCLLFRCKLVSYVIWSNLRDTVKVLLHFNPVFRVGNMRHTSLVEAHVRAILIQKRVTEEGEVLPYHQAELDVRNFSVLRVLCRIADMCELLEGQPKHGLEVI